MATLSIAREYANQSAASRAERFSMPLASAPPAEARGSSSVNNGEYMMLSGDNDNRGNGVDENDGGDPSANDAEMEVGSIQTKKGASGEAASGAQRIRRRTRARAEAADAARRGPSPLARKVLSLTRLVCGGGMAMVLIMCAVVVMFAPHAPGVNVCNTEFDWVSKSVAFLSVFPLKRSQ